MRRAIVACLVGAAVGAAPAHAQIVLPPIEVPITIEVPGADVRLSELEPGLAQDRERDIAFTSNANSAVGDGFDLQARVANAGPAPAERVLLRIALPEGARLAESRVLTANGNFFVLPPDADCRTDDPAPGGTTAVVCFFEGPLPRGAVAYVYVPILTDAAGQDLEVFANARSEAVPDPVPANNGASTSVTVTSNPDSTVQPLPDGARGSTATFDTTPPGDGGRTAEVLRPVSPAGGGQSLRRLGQVARVEVAVLKSQGNRSRCLWLADRRLKFRVRPAVNGRCASGRWLRASGTGRWRFKLARNWPPGTYTVYSRAVNRAGVRETEFSRKDKNVVTFTVRR